MKMLLNQWGLDQVPYLVQVVEGGWRIVLVLVLAWVVWHAAVQVITLARLRLATRASDADEAKRVQTMTQVFRYAVGVTIVIITAMLVLAELGISVAPLLATAGVAGIALGFGVQSLVKDYFTGFALLFENQIRQGDVIEAGGKSGLVEEVTLRYIRLRDYAGVVHFIPNSLVSTVSNSSMGYGYAVIDIGIAYDSDLDAAFELMRSEAQALRAEPQFGVKILEDIEIAGVEQLAESAVTLKARIKTLPLEQWNVRREFLRRLKVAFQKQGIEIPFPQLRIHAATPGLVQAHPVTPPAPSA
jgi:moderate conductance mechanosensitive channel